MDGGGGGDGRKPSIDKMVEDTEVEQCESGSACGSTTSMDDVESPKSVVAAAAEGVHGAGFRGKVRFNTATTTRSKKVPYGGDYLHIQVLRVKEEESHLGQGFAVGGGDVGTGGVRGLEERFWEASKSLSSSPMMLRASSPLGLGGRTNREAATIRSS